MSLEIEVAELLNLKKKNFLVRCDYIDKIHDLKDRVLKGESTGSDIRDFSLANMGLLSEDIENLYEKMKQKSSSYVGKEILVVRESKSLKGCPGIISPNYIDPSFFGVNLDLKYGILEDSLNVDIENGNLIFPMKKYFGGNSFDHDINWKVMDGNISLNWYDFFRLTDKPKTQAINDWNFEYGLQFYFDNDVKKYFSSSFVYENIISELK